ncbi:Beta-galactosidase/beta-glucuronidase [Pedobacter sp. ok626]|uniref:glycoside hydrolase family 2 TIM barrel-domain containing protein n=1 Tax=Pedobacter sp. ok626 TaxID=1761882 RepID=UPI00088C9C9B|nr:glycoside hydrolase family 2 TIM barrel-domain containing protein [Pedobacter sp. ok626]SDJ07956.1 Beta-galactosidase/beta-glucuronidase [Pedobacter sp. ok626]
MKLTSILSVILLMLFSSVRAQQTEQLYLSGTGNDDTIKWDFFCTAGMNSGKWTTISVPSNWELQGFGKYDYGFAKDSVRGKEQGLYKYNFKVPAGWKGKKINIVFEGSMTDTEVKINGKLAGPIHQGAFYVFRYDVTALLKYGIGNLLEVKVSKHSANKSVNEAERKADFWLFGGIFRPVYLEALPSQHIERVAIDAKADGQFKAELKVAGNADRVAVQLYTAEGEKYGLPFEAGLKKGSAMISRSFNSPKLWSSEFPNLYNATFTLYHKNKAVHTLSKKIGFRTIVVKPRDGVFVNGVKIKFKGVNRHSFRPASGRTLSKKNSIEDVELMKEMNMNAVRMSHYPPDGHFLDVCDSLGLYVMDELAGWHGHYDTPTGTKLVAEMMRNDVNHPSIVFWANGNEGGHNRELDPLFAQEDIQKRPVIHPWEDFNGFDTQHYREYNYGIGNYRHGHSIVMPTEFLHGMFDGGHGAGLEDYWNDMLLNPLSAGGFLWDFADQGVVRTDKSNIIDADGNRGADGIVGPYHEKEGSFFAIKEIWSPVFFEHREMTDDFDGMFNIENRYHFANLNSCRFDWKLLNLKNQQEINGNAIAPDLKPLEKGKLSVTLPLNWNSYDVLYIKATDMHGKELYTWSFPITLPKKEALAMVKKEGGAPVAIKEIDSLVTATANGISLSFSKKTGMLRQVKNGKSIIPFTNGPVVQEGATNFRNISHHMEGENLIIESSFDRKEAYNTLQWTVYPSGMLKLNVKYFPAEYLTNFIGLNFSFPEDQIKGVEYMGRGPYRVWKNRLKGNPFGVWKKDYNNTETGEAWVYPEFKGYHSNMYWCKFITKEQPFTVITENEDIFLRLFSAAFKTDQWHNYEPLFPSGDISFMQGIPGIGTKTQRADRSGPMAMKNIFYDYEKDPERALNMTLYFDFSTHN